ncbi:alpha/beta fold hydrolase [Streptomyces sp. C36]|uniref:alpha/beta fold hydrolase n=1 Tax=Streptomyces sp. C36 TaxID=3237122 RepID=UPI0034C60EBE
MPFVGTRDGTRLFYNDWGTGRPVILLGTAMMNSRMWEFQAPYLARHGMRCVTYDRRGCGRSDWPWEGYDYDTLADDLADLMEHLDLRDAALVGYAVGGGEAVRYLTRHGADRVARLALVASTTPFLMRTEDNPDGLDIALFEEMADAMARDRAAWMTALGASFFGGPEAGEDGPAAVSPELADWMTRIALDSSPRAAAEIYRTLFTEDQRAEVAKVGVPTLVVHGDADAGAPFPLCGPRTADLVPDSSFIRYEGAAHGLFATHADRLNEDLRTFLAA